MAEQFDGGIQDETNEDLEIQGFIDTGIDSSRVLAESSSTLMTIVSGKFQELATVMQQMAIFAEEHILAEHLHVHMFHKHRSCRGHCNKFPLITELNVGSTVKSGGKFFSAGRQSTAVNMLMNEMIHAKDLDDNGKRFYHDFVFDWDDPAIPPGIKQLKNNPFMPGNTLWPHEDDNYIVGFDEMLIDYQEGLTENDLRKPKFVKRKSQCIVMTWDEYYSGINEVYKQYLVI